MNPKVTIIILNWNGWEDTIECLESLYQITYPNYDVILVDNGSEDESIKNIREYCEGKIEVKSKFFKYNPENKPIKIIKYTREEAETGGGKEKEIEDLPSNRKLILIKNEKNYGFAEGNNVGMRYALKALNPNYILLLNNDTVVDKNFLKELVKVGETNKRIGVVGSNINFYNKPNMIQSMGVKINWCSGKIKDFGWKKEDKIKFDKIIESIELDAVSGCSMLIKEKVLEKIKYLDTSYFLYFEDTDFCVRTKRAGYRIAYAPQASVWHKLSITARKISGLREYYWARNIFLFMKRYSRDTEFMCFLVYFFYFSFWLKSAIIIFHHNEKEALIPFLKGVIDGLKMIKNL